MFRKRRKRSGHAFDQETIAELRDAVRDLLRDEDARAQSLNARASGLTGFVGVILSVAAAAGALGTRGAAAGLHQAVSVTVALLVAGALACLVAAVVMVVAKVLLPSPGITIATEEVERYPLPEFITQEAVMVRGYLMRGLISALKRERDRNEQKARWLKTSYLTVCTGLIFVALAGGIATIDRYVASDPKRRPSPGRPEPGAGTACAGAAGYPAKRDSVLAAACRGDSRRPF